MAREEQEREDLLRDAKAYTFRAQWQVAFCSEPVFVGFRVNGGPSFYFGQDDVYHFNTAGELRRAYLRGKLLKAEGGRLVELERVRTAGEVQLRRNELSADQANEILAQFRQQLTQLVESLTARTAQLEGEVLPDGRTGPSVAEMVRDWTAANGRPGIADQPNSG